MQKNKLTFALISSGLFLAGCASMGLGNKTADRINVSSSDRVFLRVPLFDSTVGAELSRAGLDPVKVHDNLAAELHYQLFLKKQEESPDSAGATVQVTVSIKHLQPGVGNSGNFVSGTLTAEGKETEKADWELRQPTNENVPADFLALHLPRTLSTEILSRMKAKPKRSSDLEYNPPLILLH